VTTLCSKQFKIFVHVEKKSLKKIANINNKKCHCTKTVGDGKILMAYLDSA
jgi:nitrogen regulatory protein PII